MASGLAPAICRHSRYSMSETDSLEGCVRREAEAATDGRAHLDIFVDLGTGSEVRREDIAP